MIKRISLFCFLFLTAEYALGAVVINEIMYRQNVNGTNTDEFVELYNNGTSSVDISNWVITDRENNGLNFSIPVGTNLDANQYVVIWLGASTPTNNAPLAQHQFWINDRHRLNNSGDDVLLRDSTGSDIDYVSYGSSSGLDPVPPSLSWDDSFNGDLTPAARGQSISLVPNGVDSDTSACWELTGNTSNPNTGSCPGYLPSADTSSGFDASPGRSNNLAADLSVSKTEVSGSNTYTPGQTSSYQVQITNNGPDDAIGATLQDVLPSGVNFNGAVSCLPASACSLPATNPPSGQTLNMTVDIPNGQTVTIIIPVLFSSMPTDY